METTLIIIEDQGLFGMKHIVFDTSLISGYRVDLVLTNHYYMN